MAERRGTRRRDEEERAPDEEPDESREERQSRSGRGAADGITAPEAAQAALRAIVDLTGKHPEGVTAVEPTDDGWLVGVEVVEDQRIPSSSDILAIYEAELDLDGSLMSYRRSRRYPRGRGDSGGDR